MRFLVKAFVLAVPVAMTVAAAQAPVAAPAHRAAAAPAPARRVATPRRVVNPQGQNPYQLPQAALVGHPELQGHSAGFTGIRSGAYSNSGRYYYGNTPANRGGHEHGRGFVSPYAYYSAPFLPFFDYGDSYDAGPPQDGSAADAASAQAQDAAVTAGMLGDQVQHLSAEVENLRNQQQMQPLQPPEPAVPPTPNAPYATPAPRVQQQAPAEPPITVVLKSGRKFQAQNYAIMGQTFWDFSTQPAHRIPVTAINVPASVTASSANGAEFPDLQANN